MLLTPVQYQELRNDAVDFFDTYFAMILDNFEKAGADFHFSRNGHGTGFFDRDCYNGHEQELQRAAKVYGSCELIDGQIIH